MGLKTPRAYEEIFLGKMRPFVQSVLDEVNTNARAKALLASTGSFASAQQQQPYKEVTFEAWAQDVDFKDDFWKSVKGAIVDSVTAKGGVISANPNAAVRPTIIQQPLPEPQPRSQAATYGQSQARVPARPTYGTVQYPALGPPGPSGSAPLTFRWEEHTGDQAIVLEEQVDPLPETSRDDADDAAGDSQRDILQRDWARAGRQCPRGVEDAVRRTVGLLQDNVTSCEFLITPARIPRADRELEYLREEALATIKLAIEVTPFLFDAPGGWSHILADELQSVNATLQRIVADQRDAARRRDHLRHSRTQAAPAFQRRRLQRTRSLAPIPAPSQSLPEAAIDLTLDDDSPAVPSTNGGRFWSDRYRSMWDPYPTAAPSTISPAAAEAAAAGPATTSSPAIVVPVGDGSASPWCVPSEDYTYLRDLMLGQPSSSAASPSWTVTSSSSPTATATATSTTATAPSAAGSTSRGATFRQFSSMRRASSRTARHFFDGPDGQGS